MAGSNVTEIFAQGLQSAHASEIPENSYMTGIEAIVDRQGAVQQQIVASGNDEQTLQDRQLGCSFRIIDGIGFKPLLHEVPGEKPFAGDLCRRQSFFRDKGIHHFLVDIQKAGHFFGGK